MDRPDRLCVFGSARWDDFSPFFYPCGRIRPRGDRLRRPAGDALILLRLASQVMGIRKLDFASFQAFGWEREVG
jgi:hypothetical protein